MKTHQQSGLSLIEMLVALFLASVIAVIAQQSLRQVINTQQTLEQRFEHLQHLNRVFNQLEYDLTQIVPIYTNKNKVSSEQSEQTATLAFYRHDQAYGSVLIEYVFKNQALTLNERTVNQIIHTEPLLTDVTKVQWEFYSIQQRGWTTELKEEDFISGIKLLITLKNHEPIERVYAL